MSSNDCLPVPFRESFKLVFNPKVMTEVTVWHFIYLQHMAFEDLDFTCTTAVQTLLTVLRSQERYDIAILAFRLIDFILNPIHDFKSIYLRVWQQSRKYLDETISSFHTQASVVIKEILRSQQILKSDYLLDLNNFYKSEEMQQLCNDQMSIIWCGANNGDQEPAFRRSSLLS
jgi:hypothetical protein